MKSYKPHQYPDPDDMFADTRMSFGDHIEELRVHLLRAVYGFMIGLVAAFFIGKPVLRFIAKPVEEQLAYYWERHNRDKMPEIMAQIEGGQSPVVAPPVRIPLDDLEDKLGLPEIRKKVGLPPRKDVLLEKMWLAVFQVLQKLEMDELVDSQYFASAGIYEVKPDPYVYLKSLQRANRLLRPPSLSTLNVQEAFLVYFKVCLMTGLVLSSPWVFFQIWSFIAAGLYPHEKKLVNVYLPFSLGLFLGGVLICELFVIPEAIKALLWFNEWMGFQPDLRLNEWLGFAIFMPLVFGLSFQTPLIMLFLEKIGMFDVESYRSKRKIALFLMAAFAAVITPSTDVFSLMFLWVPMCLLYELGILLCKLSPREPFLDMETEESEMVEA